MCTHRHNTSFPNPLFLGDHWLLPYAREACLPQSSLEMTLSLSLHTAHTTAGVRFLNIPRQSWKTR